MKYEFNESQRTYEITNFNEVKKEVADFIGRTANLSMVIQNDEDKKVVKQARTIIRKKKDEVATLRKELNIAVLGEFNNQAKEIEKMLDSADLVLKEKLDAYSNKNEKNYTLIFKSQNLEKLEKIKDFARNLEILGDIK